MRYEFAPLSSIPAASWLSLLSDHELHRHMPLAGGDWTEDTAADWAAAKDRQWKDNGYGPWAIRIDGSFAGWGGFQKEDADVDFALVLLRVYWGHGKALHDALIARGFGEFGFESITILLPPSRPRLTYLARLGYQPEGEVESAGHRFLKFRVRRPIAPIPAAT